MFSDREQWQESEMALNRGSGWRTDPHTLGLRVVTQSLNNRFFGALFTLSAWTQRANPQNQFFHVDAKAFARTLSLINKYSAVAFFGQDSTCRVLFSQCRTDNHCSHNVWHRHRWRFQLCSMLRIHLIKNYAKIICTINKSTICELGSPKRIPTLPTRACMDSTMKRRLVRALQTRGTSSGHCVEDDTGESAPPLRQVARQHSPPSMRGPWVLFMLLASTSGVSGPALGHSGLQTPAFLTDGQQWLVGAVLVQWRAQSLSAAMASEDESLRLWTVRARRLFRGDVVKALLWYCRASGVP